MIFVDFVMKYLIYLSSIVHLAITMQIIQPANSIKSIYVCQASTCRSKGSDAALVEIEELAKFVEDCRVESTGCLGYCRVGPAVLVRRRRGRSKKEDIHTKNGFRRGEKRLKIK